MSNEPATIPSSDASPGFDRTHRYTAALANEIEPKWQRYWEEHRTFATPNPGDEGFDPHKTKYYVLDMFPYPSGAGLHVGHPEGYTATDIVARYKRMTGHNVLHPMGWDAFGLPAEQYAVQTNVHPAKTTREAIDTFRKQLQRFGFSYDWSREFATIDPDYYRWTQWIWLQAYNSWYDARPGIDRARPIDELIQSLENGDAYVNPYGEIEWPVGVGKLEALGGEPVGLRKWHELERRERREVIDNHRLAYRGEQTVNWCPKLGTVLANEEVIDGRSERGSYPVYRMPLRQWMFRITSYAERLLRDLDGLDWPESTKAMQREWIGRSEGAEIDFKIEGEGQPEDSSLTSLRVFTTRPDTIFGATYMVIAPEHPLVDEILGGRSGTRTDSPFDRDDLRAYVDRARHRSDVERQETKEKTGVFTGMCAINPATLARIPIWTADYVLMGYGHGAVMAVPAHDERDFEFAQQFDLPIRDVVYSKPLTAIHIYCTQFIDESLPEALQFLVLIDFISMAINQDRDDYARIHDFVSEGRKSCPLVNPDRVEAGIDLEWLLEQESVSEEGALTRAGAPQRGAISRIWSETILALSGGSIERLVNAARDGRLVELTGAAEAEYGIAVNSSNDEVSLDLLPTEHAKKRIIEWLERTGRGRRRVNFKLRDWLFSRQRYWGEPFPIVFDEQGDHYPVSETKLPVRLPEMEDFRPIESDTPQPPLAKATQWVNTTAGEAGVDPTVLSPSTLVTRETNTMPNWAGSCWYYLRFCDPSNSERLVSPNIESYWMGGGEDASAGRGVDLYVGGAEHAVLHLLYARFWQKLLFDLKHVSVFEPARRLFHQGMIVSHAFQRANKTLVPVDQVGERDGSYIEIATGEPVTQITAKMSKTLKNVVNPEDVIAEYGADTFRLYEMYMGPLEASKPWNTRDIAGPFRFLQRLWRLAIDEDTGESCFVDVPNDAVERALHKAISKVGPDIDRLAFNTAIAAMMEFVNVATSNGGVTSNQMERFVLLLAPFAPHIAEELWSRMGRSGSIAYEAWPEFDQSLLVEDQIELPVQIAGKMRGKVVVSADADVSTVEAVALADEKIKAALEGKTVRKVIVVPGKIINIVAH